MPDYIALGILTIACVLMGLGFMWVNIKSAAGFGKIVSFIFMWAFLLCGVGAFVLFASETLMA